MPEQRPQTGAVAIGIARRKSAAPADFRADAYNQPGRREPFHLHRVIVEPAAEERLVRERRVLEVPRMLVNLVLVADARQKAPAFQGKAARERERLEERLLDFERVLRRERRGKLAAEIRVDIRRDEELRFAEAEAASRRPDFTTGGCETREPVVIGVLRAARSGALQDDGNVRVESIGRRFRRGALFQIVDALAKLLELAA